MIFMRIIARRRLSEYGRCNIPRMYQCTSVYEQSTDVFSAFCVNDWVPSKLCQNVWGKGGGFDKALIFSHISNVHIGRTEMEQLHI